MRIILFFLLLISSVCKAQVDADFKLDATKAKKFIPYVAFKHENFNDWKNNNKMLYYKELWYYTESFYVKRNYLTKGIYTFSDKIAYSGDSLNICLPAGDYTLNITTIGINGCKATFTQGVVNVYPKPNADFSWNPSSPNTLSESYVVFTPAPQSMNISDYLWDFHGISQSTDKSPTHQFDKQDNYTITLVLNTEHGCKDTITKIVEVRDEFLLFVPNAFTPNGDGNNDTFKPKGIGMKNYDMSIFDRWGSLIYQGNEKDKGWDGTFKGVFCQDDVYVYKITIIDNKSMRHVRTGHVTLMK